MRATQLLVACIVLALASTACAADARAPRKTGTRAARTPARVLKPGKLFKPLIVAKGAVAAMRSSAVSAAQPAQPMHSVQPVHSAQPVYPAQPVHPALPPIGGFSLVAVSAGRSAAAARVHGGTDAHRFAVVRRDRMQLVLRGWISDFFNWFERAANVLTDKVKTTVLNTVNAFEDRAVAVFKDVSALWTYFREGQNGVTKQVADLWVATRCDICQSALLHIYAKGCAYASQQICNVVDAVACGTLKPACDKFLCPVIQKVWLQPECGKIQARLDSALLDKTTKKYSVLDNFATLAVCKRVGMCREMDAPFDGDLLNAIAAQSRRLTAEAANAPNDLAAQVAKANAVTPGPIPSQRFSKEGMYAMPGLRATVSAWLNIQVKSPKYGKPYYMFWDMQSGGAAKLAGIKEGWWLNAINGKKVDTMTIAEVLQALNGQPGTTVALQFEDSGFFGSSFPTKQVTFQQWPVQYASLQRS